jgi:hypothetical protein
MVLRPVAFVVGILFVIVAIPSTLLERLYQWIAAISDRWLEQKPLWLKFHRMTPEQYAQAWIGAVAIGKGRETPTEADVDVCIACVKRDAQRRHHSQHHWADAEWAAFEREMYALMPRNWERNKPVHTY